MCLMLQEQTEFSQIVTAHGKTDRTMKPQPGDGDHEC